MLALQLIIIITLLVIVYGDFKERLVWNISFVVFGIVGSLLFYLHTNATYFLTSIVCNTLIVVFIIGVSYLMAKYVLKKKSLSDVLGLGDILFFFGFALSFPIVSFLNFFLFSILFTYALYILLKKIKVIKVNTIPLAGSMALFLVVVYVIDIIGVYENVYTL